MGSSYLLCFDLGNTNCKVGVAFNGKIISSYVLSSDERQTTDQFGLFLCGILSHLKIDIEKISACIACSVVPRLNGLVAAACKRYFNKDLLFAPENISFPLTNSYTRPHEVGADRLTGAYAVTKLYPNRKSFIVVDFGTATTFDCVSNNSYLGGLICPGVYSSAMGLSKNTAKLPQITFKANLFYPEPARSTDISLSHGFIFGFKAMTEGLCKDLSKSFPDKDIMIIGTGGFANTLSSVCTFFDAIHQDLLLEGLCLLYEEQKDNIKIIQDTP